MMSTLANDTTETRNQKRLATRPQTFAALLLVILAVAGIFAFRGLGRWLVREDPLAHADLIVVLSGSMPYRAEAAATIYRQGYAPEVWITRPASPADELRGMGIRYIPEEEYDREVLVRQGVPAGAIKILRGEIVDTEEEIDEIARELPAARKANVIIVTSPPHTRRVHTLWNRLAAVDQKVIVRASAEDPFDRDHWWRNTRDAYAVARELLGLANVWTGLSVRPHSHGS